MVCLDNTYTLTMRRDQAAELGIATISDLGEYLRAEVNPQADVSGPSWRFLVALGMTYALALV